MTLATPPFGKIFGVMSGLSLRTLVPNLKSVSLSLGTLLSNLKSVALIVFEILAFNAENLGGHVTLARPPFGKILGGHIRTVPGN